MLGFCTQGRGGAGVASTTPGEVQEQHQEAAAAAGRLGAGCPWLTRDAAMYHELPQGRENLAFRQKQTQNIIILIIMAG